MASTIKVDNIQDQDGNNIINENANTITIGASGDTVTLASGASQSGFGRTGTVDWDTTAKTATFTGVSGNGYFVNTTAGVVTANLPASPSAGDIMAIVDYAGTADTNNITVGRNGSNINGAASDQTISKENSGATFVYVDGTQGWKFTETSNVSDIALQPAYVAATGGTITTCGDYKIHTFTGPGTFCVSCGGNVVGSTTVDYLVVAGGGGGGSGNPGSGEGGGGGGAGGYRESSGTASGSYTASPLGSGVSALPVSVTGYPITVGGGGSGESSPGCGVSPTRSGNNSVFSTITSAAGGGGGTRSFSTPIDIAQGAAGGSGGGGAYNGPGSAGAPGGNGNTPPVSPPQGNNGGSRGTPGSPNIGCGAGGGGGGATAVGANAGTQVGGNGGAGATSSINGTPTTRAGGGGGGGNSTQGTGGPGGGGNGANPSAATAGTANTGGGGGGGFSGNASKGGGSGIVIIRYKFQ